MRPALDVAGISPEPARTLVVGLLLIAVCGTSSLAADDVHVFEDDVSAGLQTAEEIDAEPYGFRVTWIGWDSGFRATGLEIGDRIIGVDGTPCDRAARAEKAARSIGGHAEPRHWLELGRKDGSSLTLTVDRRGHELQLEGRLRAKRQYKNSKGQRLLGAGGPPGMVREAGLGSWTPWYEDLIRFSQRVLDGGWQSASLNNRKLLRQHDEGRDAIDHLIEHYPGPFTDAVVADWEEVRRSLEGELREVTPESLEYRELGEKRAAQVAASGRAAREPFLAELAEQTVPAFPAIDPIETDPQTVAGKVVVLPPLSPRDWVMEGDRAFMLADGEGGSYVVDCASESMQRLFGAVFRYQSLVSPRIRETYSLVARIGAEPRMLVRGRRAVIGLLVEVLGASVGDQMFVDLRGEEDAAAFAGEEQLRSFAPPPLGADAGPAAVAEALVAAIKSGHEESWRGLYATWSASGAGSRARYYPFLNYREGVFASEWQRARSMILDQVFDVRVVWVSPPRTVLDDRDFEGAPHIEEVTIELEHIGLFDGEYRTFTDSSLHRMRRLQRRAGGRWHFTELQGL